MQKITLSDFSGGIQEATGPGDFTERQWAKLKGFIPQSEAVFESQWPAQQVGSDGGFQFVVPLPSSAGTFLVAVKAPGEPDEGTIWWAKAPDSEANFVSANNTTWTQIINAENKGLNPQSSAGASQGNITITPNPDFRFISYIPLEIYQYAKVPSNSEANKLSKDDVALSTPKSSVSGALFHSRRRRSATGYTSLNNQQAVVVYVDPEANFTSGAVRAVTFPNWRRMPQKDDNTFLGVNNLSGSGTLFNGYPRPLIPSGLPAAGNDHHPYSYKDANGAVLAGRGVIPRANTGAIWNQLLVLGDVEHRSDQAALPGQNISDNRILFSLNDSNTAPHRGYMYFAAGNVDEFYPIDIIKPAGTDSAILGMHIVKDTLVIVTTAGGDSDGVIVIEGDPTQIYDTATNRINPSAIRKTVLRGGIGGVPRDDREAGHRAFSALWPEAGTVVFIDKLGGVWYTTHEDCDRLDRFGPLPPVQATVDDHVASFGRHLLVWRGGRLLAFNLLDSYDGEGSGCWTELVPPADNIKSMYGLGEEMYMICDGNVWRYTVTGPREERGCINGQQIDLTVSTQTLGEPDEQSRKHWHRFGVTLETLSSCVVDTASVIAGSASRPQYASAVYTVPVNKEFTVGEGRFVVPAGIGSQTLASATVVFRGDVRLQEFAFWVSGGSPAR